MAKLFLTLAQIAAGIPAARASESISVATLSRWITQGCPGRDGTATKLKATQTAAGGRWLVQQADLDQFFAALAGELETPTTAPNRTDAARRKEVERAKRELQDAGC